MKCRGKSSVGPISFSRESWHCLITFTSSARRFRRTNTPSGCNTAQLAFFCCLSLLLHSPPSFCAKEPGNVCHGSNGKRENSTSGPAPPLELQRPPEPEPRQPVMINVDEVDFCYGTHQVLFDVNLEI